MRTQTQDAVVSRNDAQADDRRAQLAAALEHADSNRQERKQSLFREAYDLIVPAMARKVPQKTILAALEDKYGLKLHPARFRELLDAETERREKAGDALRCTLCDHLISPMKRVTLSDLLAGMPGHPNREEAAA
jgi:hypothetical protein